MRKLGKRLLAGAFAFCMLSGLTGCGKEEELFGGSGADVRNLMEGIEVQAATAKKQETSKKEAQTELQQADEKNIITDFSVRLLQNSIAENTEQNAVLSPVSVLYALAMTANGAREETLAQMEAVFGMSVEELNECLSGYLSNYESKKCKWNLANSLWFTEEERLEFKVSQEFLETNAACYDAEIYQTVFDAAAKDAINAWVSNKTNGMIKDILDEIPEDAIMYLVNAVAFDAEWEEIYKDSQIWEQDFVTATGEEQKADFMHSDENVYLEDENVTGMLKYYSGRNYAFVALLPKEGMSVEEYIRTLNGEKLQALLENKQSIDVDVAMPKFSCEAAYNMNDILSTMGMPDAFDKELANFHGMGTIPVSHNIWISRVLHKAKIEVDGKGTKAGAATVVEMTKDGAAPAPAERKEVILNRPFLYMLVDCNTNLPIFMGTITHLK